MQEESFVRALTRLFPPGEHVRLGIGDDCAALEIPGSEQLLLAAVDQVVESVHYLPGTTPRKIAGKLVRRKAIKEQGHLCKSSLLIGGEASNWSFDGLISKIVLTPRAKSAQELSNAGKEIQQAAKKLEDL